MGFGESSLFLKINLILLILTVIIQILGLALPYWIVQDLGFIKINSGLWQSCSEGTCASVISAPDWYNACRAFAILGLLALVGALACTAIVMFLTTEMKVLKLGASVLAFVAAFCIMIEFAVFASKMSAVSSSFSGAFAITIIAFLTAIVCGVLGLLDWLGKGK